MKKSGVLFLALFLLVGSAFASTQLISYQGRVGQNGQSVLTGNVTVYIYDSSSGGSLIWSDNFTDAIDKGYFDITIGSGVPLSLVFGQHYYLDMDVNGENINWTAGADRVEFESSVGSMTTSVQNQSGWIRESGKVYLYDLTDNVGIGTTSPTGKFQINSTDGTAFFVNATNGYVGIGTTDPGSILELHTGPQAYMDNGFYQTSSSTADGFIYTEMYTGIYNGCGAASSVNGWETGLYQEGIISNPYDYWYIGRCGGTIGLQYLRDGNLILEPNNEGNVGIGTSNPQTKLHINATDGLVIPVGTTIQRNVNITGMIRYNTETSQFEGYGLSSWGSLGGVIDVNQDTKITAEDSPGINNDQLKFFTNGTERMRIDSNGYVGIWTTNPQATLDVNGTIKSSEGVEIGSSVGSASLTVYGGVTSANSLQLAKDILMDDLIWDILNKGNNFEIGEQTSLLINDYTSRFIILNGSGYVGIGTLNPLVKLHVNSTDGIIIPVGNNTERINVIGVIRFNDELSQFEGYTGSDWASLGGMVVNNTIVYNQTMIINNNFTINNTFFTTINSSIYITNTNQTIVNSTTYITNTNQTIINSNTFMNNSNITIINGYINTTNLYVSEFTGENITVTGFAHLATVSGNVGVGTENPSSKLHVNTTDSTPAFIASANDSYISGEFEGRSGKLRIKGYEDSGWGTWIDATSMDELSYINLSITASTLKLQTNGGRVGIGIVNPNATLSVNGLVQLVPRTTATCDSTVEGAMFYNSSSKHFYGCNGVSWIKLDTTYEDD